MPRAFISTILVAKKLDELPNVMAEAPERLYGESLLDFRNMVPLGSATT
jgi:hypothetical protein